jgi:hypothetical protein
MGYISPPFRQSAKPLTPPVDPEALRQAITLFCEQNPIITLIVSSPEMMALIQCIDIGLNSPDIEPATKTQLRLFLDALANTFDDAVLARTVRIGIITGGK